MAPRAMNHGGGEPSLASLIERSAELKQTLVDFALSPRFGRHLEQFMLQAADPVRAEKVVHGPNQQSCFPAVRS